VRVYGTVELVDRETKFGLQPVMKITPTISWSANLDGRPLGEARDEGSGFRRTVHQAS
jgi:pyridoxamine 5'-phosphate oxidase family protein